MEWNLTYLFWAIFLGLLSSLSLPIGSVVGLQFRFRPLHISILAAFGAGALMAALSIELIAPTALRLTQTGGHAQATAKPELLAMLAGAVLGGGFYYVLDQLVNKKGGYLRKTTNHLSFFLRSHKNREAKLIEAISEFPLMRQLSPEDLKLVIPKLYPVSFSDGDLIVKKGEMQNRIVLVRTGKILLSRYGELYRELKPGKILGILGVQQNLPSPGEALAKGRVTGLALDKAILMKVRQQSPAFNEAFEVAVEERLMKIEKATIEQTELSVQWKKKVMLSLRTGKALPNSSMLKRVKPQKQRASLAIWLGMLLDGIPESFVIGSGVTVAISGILANGVTPSFGQIVPYTLIAGLFLSNFPEALSSSANMKNEGWRKEHILLMWVSLTVITGIGAGIGYWLSNAVGHSQLALVEGIAAGAMLTMIAAAMIPEAVHIGNPNAVGLSTLTGFLAAVAFKLLE